MTSFKFRTHESVVSGQSEDLSRTVIMFSIGTAPYFNRKALAFAVMSWRVLKVKPSTAIVLHVGGYDEDPRELWQIPEARDFIRRFCEKTQAHKHPALEPMSRNLLLLCGAEPDLHVEALMVTAEDSSRQTQKFFRSRTRK